MERNREHKEKTAEYMRLAVPLMRKYGVAMTPDNYSVWYGYVSGSNAALKDAVDESIKNQDQLTSRQCKQLYEKFFDHNKAQTALLDMRKNLKHVLTEVLSYINSGVSSSEESISHLNECLEKFHPDMSQEQVQNVIEEVLVQTKEAMSVESVLTERLDSARSDMQELKKDLDGVIREAKVDTLTKLANRQSFDDIMVKVTRDADSSGIEVCMIFGDLDHFKNINDKHGHLVGDQVLRVVATGLKNAVKGRDLVCRYSGEEFAILVLNTRLENVKKLAESIRKDIESKRIQRKDTRESLGAITMSFGIARYFPSEGIESFLQRADRALYMSKSKGRNMISEAPPPSI